MCWAGVLARLTAATGVVWGDAGGEEAGGEGGEVAAGHVEDEGGLGGEGALPGDGFRLAGGVVGGGEDELGGGGAVGEGGLEEGGGGEGGGDAGDDLEGDLGGAEGFDFLVDAAEDEGVAGFEAQDGCAEGCACWSMRAWMPAWVMRGWPQRLPTGMISAAGLARARISSETRSSGRMTSQWRRRWWARRVRREGSPGPAPQR